MVKARPSLYACSFIPNTMFLFLSPIIQLLKTIKPAHKILSLLNPQKNVEVNPIYEYFLLFYRRINMAVLNCIGIKSSHITFTLVYNRKFDWLIVDPIWLVWHTYISHWSTEPWSTEPPVHNICDTRTKRYFFYKKYNSKTAGLVLNAKCKIVMFTQCSRQWSNKLGYANAQPPGPR